LPLKNSLGRQTGAKRKGEIAQLQAQRWFVETGLVYAAVMHRLLAHCLIALVLLLQGIGSAWSASRMVSAEVQFSAHLAELPPCHRQALKESRGKDATTMRCCGTASCHCVMSCGGLPALPLQSTAAFFARQSEFIGEHTGLSPRAIHYGPGLRPPAILRS